MNANAHKYYVLHKPYNMVSQFISSHDVNLLGNIDFEFPEGIHAIGRLDNHSEGLLLLTTNKKITRLLFLGEKKHNRTYLVQVNNILSEDSLQRLRLGVSITIKGNQKYTTPGCVVEMIEEPEKKFPFLQTPETSYGLHSWLLITLTEGKFHQMRKMIAAVHHRCKRLIRISIEDLELDGLLPGCTREIAENEFFSKLKI